MPNAFQKKEENNDILSVLFVAKPLKEEATSSVQRATASSIPTAIKTLVPTATAISVPLDDLDSINCLYLFDKSNDFAEID